MLKATNAPVPLTRCREPLFDGVPDIGFDLGARQAVEFPDAGRRESSTASKAGLKWPLKLFKKACYPETIEIVLEVRGVPIRRDFGNQCQSIPWRYLVEPSHFRFGFGFSP